MNSSGFTPKELADGFLEGWKQSPGHRKNMLDPDVTQIGVGVAHVFIRHTSASLTLNENASPDVRRDFETYFSRAVPEDADWAHSLEGPDDMPAHIKASLLGPALTLPVADGRLALGTWQGVYLCEHRDHGGPRSVLATAWGEQG